MEKITKENSSAFLDKFFNLHDSMIDSVNYDSIQSKVEIVIHVFWSGTPKLVHGVYQTNPTKIKVVGQDISKIMIEEEYLNDVIEECVLKFDNSKKEFYFANASIKPSFELFCKYLEWEML